MRSIQLNVQALDGIPILCLRSGSHHAIEQNVYISYIKVNMLYILTFIIVAIA